MFRLIFLAFISVSSLLLMTGCSTKVAQVRTQQAITVEDEDEVKPVAITKVVAKMRRGTKIGKIQRGLLCTDVIGGDIKWRASGKVNWSNEELTDVFREELESNGWPVVGSTDDLFAGWDVSGAEILIGAKIGKIEATVCFGPVNIFHPNGTSKGAVRLDVEWQIYNPSRKALIGTFYSSGSHEEKSKSENGHLFLMETAFANAANNLLASRDFLNLVKRSDEVVAAPSGDSTIIPNVKQKPTTLEMILERAQKSTVVIRTAVGHGSGFSIGDGTLLLTNAHVVGEAQKCRRDFEWRI